MSLWRRTRSACRLEALEGRVMLVVAGARPAPDPLDESILFRLPLASDTTTHYYYDRNGAAAGALAWNGTSQSYDGHTGSDYSGGPRGKAVYAVAGGIIVAKVDGYADFQGGGNGNYIKLNHGNDRNGTPMYTWYLHLNAGSLTTKVIGDYVAPGEQLGGVGTSGNSTGLHLHLHVAYGSTVLDPYAASGETTWWYNQGSGSPSTTAAPNKFNIGDVVEVFALAGGTLTVRSPDPTSSSIGTQVDGAVGQVISGPVLSYLSGDYNNNVYNRYKVRFSNGMEGWVAQNWLKKSPAPEIGVAQGATPVIDGQATAIDFGSVQQGTTAPTLVFTVTNSGNQTMNLGAPSLPAGYTITEALASTIAAGASDTFTVRLDSAVLGTKSGQISFTTNDPDENPFNFPITGVVTGDVVRPTADVVDVSPDPWTGPLDNITIVFSEPVTEFTVADLRLFRGVASMPLTAAQTLTTSDDITFVLGNLAPLTQASGTYALIVVSSGISDLSGNPVLANVSDTFKIQTSLFRGDVTAAANDSYYLRRSTDGTKVEIFENTAPGPTPTYTLAFAGLSSLTFDALAGNNTLTIDYTHGDPVPAGAGGLAFLASGGSNSLAVVGAGTLTLHADASASASNLSLSVGAANVILNASQRFAGLAIGAGRLDLRDKSVVVDYSASSPLAALGGYVATAYAGGAWTGGGIGTSLAADAAGVAIAEASDALNLGASETAMWAGRSVDATTILLRYSLTGDANVDGQLDGDDYFRIDAGYASQLAGYEHGDFDFNGAVDADDYFLIDSGYNKPPMWQSASPAASANTFAAVEIASAYERLTADDLELV